MPTKQRPEGVPLLAHAVDAILNRIRVLAREMCPADRQKLEEVVTKAFADLAQIAAVETEAKRNSLH